jgi:hypothetical protein
MTSFLYWRKYIIKKMLNMFRLADWEGKFVVVASRPHPPRAHIPIDTESAVPTFHHSTSLRLLSCPKASGACAFPSPRCRHQPLLSPPSPHTNRRRLRLSKQGPAAAVCSPQLRPQFSLLSWSFCVPPPCTTGIR